MGKDNKSQKQLCDPCSPKKLQLKACVCFASVFLPVSECNEAGSFLPDLCSKVCKKYSQVENRHLKSYQPF